MKFFTLPALLAAALFSAAVVVPFSPGAKTRSSIFGLEVRMQASAAGHVQVYYDDGHGWSEQASSRLVLTPGTAPNTYRLPIPPGKYLALRFDPIDRSGTVVIASLRVTAETGRVVADIPLSRIKPVQQIDRVRHVPEGLELVTAPGANDPQTEIAFAPPLELTPTLGELGAGMFQNAAIVFFGFAALFAIFDRSPAVRRRTAHAGGWVVAHPGRGIALIAAVSVLLSAYPVVFLGKSFVSPNGGTTLLYDTYPTLPGYNSSDMLDAKGSDVGAIMWQHIAYSAIQHRALAQGELPLWNRYDSAGTPLLGQGQSMFGDPLHFLVVLFDGAAWAWDLKYLLAKWLFATALGLLVMAVLSTGRANRPGEPSSIDYLSTPSRLGGDASPYPAMIVAAAAPFIGFFIVRINHPAIFSLSYAPWLLYMWIRATQSATLRGTAWWFAGLMLANWSLMNSGTAKEAYMLLLAMNFSGACVLLASGMPWPARLGKLAMASWAGALFVLISLPVWGTFLHTLAGAYTTYNAVSAYQIEPSLLLGAFDELFYRPLTQMEWVFNPSLNFLLLLGFLYFLATLRLHFTNRLVMALAASSLVPLALAFGLVPASWIVRVPFLGNVAHIDNCFTCALIVIWAVLAGVGFARAGARLRTTEGRGDLVIAGLLLGALVFGWIAFRQTVHRSLYQVGSTFSVLKPGEVIPVADFVWAMLVVLLVASVVLAWAVRRSLLRGQLTPALAIVIMLSAITMLWRFGMHTRSIGFENYVVRPAARANFHAHSAAVDFLQAATAKEPARGFGLHGNFFGGWTGMYGLETIYGADALVNPWYRELTGSIPGVERAWEWRLYGEPEHVGEARPFLDAINVRYYLDLQSDQGILGKSLHLDRTGDLDIYESPTAWPRAFFTDRLFVYDQLNEFMHQIGDGDGRPFAAAQRSDVAGQNGLAILWRDLKGRAVTPATNYRLTENTTTFDVHANGAGVIVLNEVYWPGDFRVEVNGHKAPIVRLNHAFKGVAIPGAGDFHMSFRYVPRGWPRNLALSGLGFALLAGSLFVAGRSRVPALRAGLSSSPIREPNPGRLGEPAPPRQSGLTAP